MKITQNTIDQVLFSKLTENISYDDSRSVEKHPDDAFLRKARFVLDETVARWTAFRSFMQTIPPVWFVAVTAIHLEFIEGKLFLMATFTFKNGGFLIKPYREVKVDKKPDIGLGVIQAL